MDAAVLEGGGAVCKHKRPTDVRGSCRRRRRWAGGRARGWGCRGRRCGRPGWRLRGRNYRATTAAAGPAVAREWGWCHRAPPPARLTHARAGMWRRTATAAGGGGGSIECAQVGLAQPGVRKGEGEDGEHSGAPRPPLPLARRRWR